MSASLVARSRVGDLLRPDDLGFAVFELAPSRVPSVIQWCSSVGSMLSREASHLGAVGLGARLSFPRGIDQEQANEVLEFLAAITGPDEADLGLSPIVVGALPFDAKSPAELVVPEITIFTDQKGEGRALLVGTKDRLRQLSGEFPITGTAPPREAEVLPDAFSLSSTRSHQDFKDLVGQALGEIGAGGLEKVVVAREVLVRANRPFVQRDLLARLRALYPSCATFAIDGFLGASPELLIRREGLLVHSQPLAGTAPRTGDPEEDARRASELFSSDKERAEHRFVVDAISSVLEPVASTMTVPDRPHLLELRNVMHLATMISATLSPGSTGTAAPNALELALALHPTPAVGGVPRAAALAFLTAHEHLERDRYAGPVGFMTATGDGEFWVGIRSAMISGEVARLLAGVGIVSGSLPEEELAETQLKLQALLSAAVRP